jgi:AraC-like DNA-binding protein
MAAVLVLLNNREKLNYSVVFLTILLLVMAYTSSCGPLYALGICNVYFGIIELEFINILVIAPLLYLYILTLTRPNFSFKRRYFLHFLPCLVYVLVNWHTYLYNFPANWQELYLHPLHQNHQAVLRFAQLQLLIYILVCLWLIRKHNQVIEELMSSVENRNLHWLRDFMLAAGLIFATWVISDLANFPKLIYAFVIFVMTYWVGYKVAKQKEVFAKISPNIVLDTIDNVNETPQIRYKNSAITEATQQVLMQKIEEFMQGQKPFLNNELTLPMLADQLDLSTNSLSQVLNEGFGENFYRFINRYRIEESQRLLQDPALAHFNILGVAFEAGFNSKATFNKTFKEIVGVSPSVFVKNKQNLEIS